MKSLWIYFCEFMTSYYKSCILNIPVTFTAHTKLEEEKPYCILQKMVVSYKLHDVQSHWYCSVMCRSLCDTESVFCLLFCCSLSMRGKRRRRAREQELTNSRCWTCCFLLLRSTSTTTSKTWWISPNSLW